MASIEPLYLVHARPSVFRQSVDVHFTLGESEPHTDRRVTKRIERMAIFKDGVLFEVAGFQELVELTLNDPLGAGAVSVLRKEQVVLRS